MFSIFNKKEESLKKQTYLLFAGKFIAFTIQVLVPIILVRLLTKEDYGFYQLALLIALTIHPILRLGLDSSLYYFYRIYSEKQAQLLSQTFLMTNAIGIIALLIFIIIEKYLASIFGIDIHPDSTMPIVYLIFFMHLSGMLDHIFIIERKAILNAAYLITEQLIRALFVISVVYYLRNIYTAIWGLVVFYLLKYLALLVYILMNYKSSLKNLDSGLVKEQLKYSLPFGAGVIVGQLANKVDKFIASSLVGLSSFASYSVASFRIPLLGMVYDSICNVAIPELSVLSSNGNKAEAHRLLNKIIVKTSIITIPVLVFFELNADIIIIMLFTDKYTDSIWPFRIILLSTLFQAMAKDLILRSFNKTTVQFRIAVIMLFVSAFFGGILTYLFGIVGASVAFVLGIGTAHVLSYIEEIKVLGIRLRERFPFRDLGYLFGISFISILPGIPVYFFREEYGYFNTLLINAATYFPLVTFFLHKKSYINISFNFFKRKKNI